MNRQLVLQADRWDSYDYGEGYYYQSSDELGITGLRDTTGRVEAFGLKELLTGRSVLEIGCNAGFLSIAIAPSARRLVAFELNPYLIAIGELGADFLGFHNVEFSVAAFEDFTTDETFDDVLSFANHHTYDGNTRQSLAEYFERCHTLTRPGGRLIFESHPPEIEGGYFDPGSTSMIASGIAAAFAGIVLFFKMGARRVLGMFSPKRRRAAAKPGLVDEES